MNEDDQGFLATRPLDDGRWLAVVPLTYGRARMTVSGPEDWPYGYSEAW